MRGRIRSVSGHKRQALTDGWTLCRTDAGAVDSPAQLVSSHFPWISAEVPGTAASALRAQGLWSLDGAPVRFDECEWWYKTRFANPASAPEEEVWLGFDGLATVADVWLNGDLLFSSTNMFAAHEHRVDQRLQMDNELLVRFRSLDALLKIRRPRPRWRAPMVENQQLRWFRTTLLGRAPGWAPPAAPVGPWREIWLERRRDILVRDVKLDTRLQGDMGTLAASCSAHGLNGVVVKSVAVVLERDGRQYRAMMTQEAEPCRFAARVTVPTPVGWWPHTHGDPALYRLWLELELVGATESCATVELGRTGFRSLDVDTRGGDFSIRVNAVRVFCRGACWTPLDVVSLNPTRAELEAAIAQVRSAGMNTLRVCGPMVYESDAFFDLCDENGILVWQDFMFANMDYPDDDAAFLDTVQTESRQILARLQGRPCLAVLCGNSEVEQQAAMFGAPRTQWMPRLFHEILPAICREEAPGTFYWPSSAHGGAFPHQVNSGTTSYYGVGAYLRSLEDARRTDLRFASECLGFANLPADSGLQAMPGGQSLRVHHPAWKLRVPRDLGAGWDFDDVRDHYLAEMYRGNALSLRYADHERYIELSRIVTGEVMAATFGEWRRQHSTCRGALIWLLRDLWHGPGWGVVDASGMPKPAYYLLSRALQPVALFISDEGANGLTIEISNDRAEPLSASVEVVLYRYGEVPVARGARHLVLAGHSSLAVDAAELFDGFVDLAYAYRFGRPAHDMVVTRLRNNDGDIVARHTHFPLGRLVAREADLGLTIEGRMLPDGEAELTLRTRRLARAVNIEVPGFLPDDNYLDVLPEDAHIVRLRPIQDARALKGTARPVNAESPTRFVVGA